MPFAEHTDVSEEKSRAEIESSVRKYGASKFMSGYDDTTAQIGFVCRERLIRFRLKLPQANESRFTHVKHAHMHAPKVVKPDQARRAYEQERRRLWRALALCIKGKLESVASGIETFEEAFLANIVLHDGSTVAERALPEIAAAYKANSTPRLMLGTGAS